MPHRRLGLGFRIGLDGLGISEGASTIFIGLESIANWFCNPIDILSLWSTLRSFLSTVPNTAQIGPRLANALCFGIATNP